jgi:hypothetical protein
MRGFKCEAVVLVIGLVLALSSLLAACGVTETGSTPAGAGGNPSPGTTVVVNGTTATAQVVPSTTASPTSSSDTHDTSGKVTLVLDKTSYAPGSTAIVTIGNGLSTKIVVSDHHTDCTYVQLQQQVAGAWRLVGECKLMTPTRLVALAAGSATPQKIVIPSGAQAAGAYRVALTYSNTTIYSSTFTVT